MAYEMPRSSGQKRRYSRDLPAELGGGEHLGMSAALSTLLFGNEIYDAFGAGCLWSVKALIVTVTHSGSLRHDGEAKMDQRRQTIRRTVAELVAFESELAGRLERAQQLSRGYPDALVAIQRLQPVVRTHHDQLVTYLIDFGAVEAGEETPSPKSTLREPIALSEVLRDLCLAFHHCALSYAMLFEVALTLYEPVLRKIAPEHLKAHAEAALSTAQLLPGVVAWQLAQEGFHCACICPMCSLGACGCVAYGTETLTGAWRDAAPKASEPPGFVLQPPKPGSQLARAGVHGGELVLAVDDQQVRGFSEIQAAIRNHALGDEVRLLIQRTSSQLPRELYFQHVSDYPKT